MWLPNTLLCKKQRCYLFIENINLQSHRRFFKTYLMVAFFKHPIERHKSVKALPSLQSVQKDEIKIFTYIDQFKIGDRSTMAKYKMLILADIFWKQTRFAALYTWLLKSLHYIEEIDKVLSWCVVF